MPVTLPLANQQWPYLRLLTRDGFDAQRATPNISGSGWEIWPVSRVAGKDKPNGMYVIDFDRVCLPQVGRARFGFRYGKIDGQIIGASATTAQSAKSGQPAGSSAQVLSLPDLNGHEVRIQASADGTAWRTVWWGRVDSAEDVGWPGALVPAGDRVYHCVDGFYRTALWEMNRHGFTATDPNSGTAFQYGPMLGHPGYNVGFGHAARQSGNLWNVDASQWTPDAAPTGTDGKCYYHGQPGSADCTAWSDQGALENALAAARRPTEPLFKIRFVPTTAAGMLVGASAWPVHDGDTVWDLATRILRRERGKGVAFVDWDNDSGAPTGPLTVYLTIMPQMYGDITYQDPTGTQVSISGAHNDVASYVDRLDLIGDHRLVASAFRLGDKDQFRLDALETVGERIQVLVTLAFVDGQSGSSPSIEGRSLRRGWSTADQTTFRAKTAVQRQEERFRAIYNLYTLPNAWDFVTGDGNGGPLNHCDYRCAGGDPGMLATWIPGSIVGETALSAVGIEPTSPVQARLLSDLPLYEMWNYSVATPRRWDAANERGDQPRRPILALLRVASDKYVKVEEVAPGMSMRLDGNAIWFFDSVGLGDGTRKISDPSLSSLGALATIGKYENLCFTVGVELPHRVRLYSGKPRQDPDCRRFASIGIPEHHLWLAHPGAIWDLDSSTGTTSTGHPPRRGAVLGTSTSPGLLRDDRVALARQHYLAWAWYGTPRRTACWALRACGFLPTFDFYASATLPTNGANPSTGSYPTIGQTIHQLRANGETQTIDTPVTRVHYDNQAGVTTWETDWNSLDLQ